MLTSDQRLYIARTHEGRELNLPPALANRHGLVAGATGTGKTVTLQNLAESFSALGVPVFLTDIKGDLAGLSRPGQPAGGLLDRIGQLDLGRWGYQNRAFPVCFWDVFGRSGHPLRATVSSLGPLLLSRLLNLNEVQSGVLHLIFRLADEEGLLLLDFKDLRSLTAHVGEKAGEVKARYGHVSPATLGAIQRALLRLEDEGAADFFGEPSLAVEDLFLTDPEGRGMLHILAADHLFRSPRLYSALLLWLLSELYERLPEQGDQDRPRLVLMFDEAHLIFSEAPPVLLEKMEQVVRLIRSKGVGIYFITQNPADVPESILGQLGHRIQHALRAYTPNDQRAVAAAARTFRPNPAFKTEEVITQLAIGEALVSFLDASGVPGLVERALILPPEARVGAISPEERRAAMASSHLAGRYDTAVDRESAYELLSRRVERTREAADPDQKPRGEARKKPGLLDSLFQDVARQATRAIGREVGRGLLRGILGGLFGGRKK